MFADKLVLLVCLLVGLSVWVRFRWVWGLVCCLLPFAFMGLVSGLFGCGRCCSLWFGYGSWVLFCRCSLGGLVAFSGGGCRLSRLAFWIWFDCCVVCVFDALVASCLLCCDVCLLVLVCGFAVRVSWVVLVLCLFVGVLVYLFVLVVSIVGWRVYGCVGCGWLVGSFTLSSVRCLRV